MKLHTVFITYNRLELTKQAIESYLETVSVPFTFLIVDNASTDGTQHWLHRKIALSERLNVLDIPKGSGFSILPENRYPGFATNHGWSGAPKDATHLQRADNDFIFLPGWCDEVELCFQMNHRLGQLGMRTDEEEMHNSHNVGGNCVIRRQLWDDGLRWDERSWPEIKVPGYTEDSFMSPAVSKMGWEWSRVKHTCIQSISFEDLNDPYYQQTWADRGILPK